VAGIAIDHGVRARKRKPVIVLLHLPHRDGPTLHRVALFAIGAQLAFMNIRVAILAAVSNV
jgi:hypothetical protein